MPAYGAAGGRPTSGPPAGGRPISGPPTGGHRGAAQVPLPPPPRPETGYLPGQSPGGRRRGDRGPVILLGVLIGVLVLLGVGLGAWALLGKDKRGAGAADQAPPNPAVTDLPCDWARTHTDEQVRNQLVKDGFTVNQEATPGRAGSVVDVTPCQARPGATITVKVGNGQGTGGRGGGGTTGTPRHSNAPGGVPTPPSASAGGGTGGGGGHPSPSCGLNVGDQLCVSTGPNPSGSR